MQRNSVSSIIDGRRKLRTVALTVAGLHQEMTNLQKQPNHLVEFEIKYLGMVRGVSWATDTTNRTEVLKIIDRGKKQGLIPLQLNSDNDAILVLSTEMVKILERAPPEKEMKTLQLHKIAQVCYVAEEGQHILAVTHGSQDLDLLNMTVLLSDSKEQAEGIISIWSECFHLVYAEAMVELIEETIDMAISAGPVSTPTPTGDEMVDNRPAPSDISNTSTQAELLKDYMFQLRTRLKMDELKHFSRLWKNWNYSTNKLQEFCDSLFKLFGPERTYLLTGLFPFIPERDCTTFENFLTKHHIPLPGTGTVSSLHGFPTFYTRSISDMSINSNTAVSSDTDFDLSTRDIDTELEAMTKNMEAIAISVGEPTQSYFPGTDRNSKV